MNLETGLSIGGLALRQKKKGRKFTMKLSMKEKKILTTFSLEPSFKEELEAVFDDLGLGWSAGVRFALKEFYKKYGNN